jgi:hypothetical protein
MRRVLQYLYDTREARLTFKRGDWAGLDGTVCKANLLYMLMLAMLEGMKDIVRLALRLCRMELVCLPDLVSSLSWLTLLDMPRPLRCMRHLTG